MAYWRRASRRKGDSEAVGSGPTDMPTQENQLPVQGEQPQGVPPQVQGQPLGSPASQPMPPQHPGQAPARPSVPPVNAAPAPRAPGTGEMVSPELADAYHASQSAELDLGTATAPRHALPPDWIDRAARTPDGPGGTVPSGATRPPQVSGIQPVGPTSGRTVGYQPTSIPTDESATVSQIDNAISDLLPIDGATGAAIVDISSGMALASGGNPGFDLTVAAAGNSNVIRAKLKTMQDLGLRGRIDDILITLDEQYHLINVLADTANQGLFVYLVLNRDNANLALARHKLTAISRGLKV